MMAVTGVEAIAAIKIKGAVTMFLGGPTGSGKTHFTRRLIENRREMFEDYPEAVHYCYVEWQPKLFGEMQTGRIQFHQGLDLSMPRLVQKRGGMFLGEFRIMAGI